MYNLLVSADEDAWNGEPVVLEERRCVYEYTENSLSDRFYDLNDANIEELRQYPCIFAYEAFCEKDPKFGLIKNVRKRQGQVKIEYEVIKLQNFISHLDLKRLMFELDIDKWEMNRTHWALKDVNLPKELSAIGVHLPQWSRSSGNVIDITQHIFDVAFSFPGEIRNVVEPIVMETERKLGPTSYFYDNNYIAQLARPSLDTLLQDIYGKRSKLIVVFLCSKYQEKEWCGIEFRAIKEILMSKQHEKIMFVRTDDGKVDGVFRTDGYIDSTKFDAAEIAGFIQERLELLR